MLAVYTYIQVLKDRLTPDPGATAVEYGLLVALIAAVIIGLVATLGGQIRNAFQIIVNNMP